MTPTRPSCALLRGLGSVLLVLGWFLGVVSLLESSPASCVVLAAVFGVGAAGAFVAGVARS